MSNYNLYESDEDVAFEAERQAEVASAIADIVANLPPDEEGEYVAAVDAEPIEGQPVVTDEEYDEFEGTPDEQAEAQKLAAPKADKPDDASARGMLRLQEKEAELRKAQESFQAEKAGWEARLKEYESKLEAAKSEPKGLTDQALKDSLARPFDFLKSKGFNPVQVARLIVAQHMQSEGVQVPPQLQDEIYKAQQAAELADLRAELQRDREAIAKERTRMSARDYARGEGSSKYPALSAVAKVDPDLVGEEVVKLTDSGLSKEEACEKLNAHWSKFQKAFGAPADSSKQVVPQPAESVSKGASVKAKKNPPPRSRPYWEDDRAAEVEAAIAEATAIAKGRARPRT